MRHGHFWLANRVESRAIPPQRNEKRTPRNWDTARSQLRNTKDTAHARRSRTGFPLRRERLEELSVEQVRPPRSQASGRLKSAALAIASEARRLTVKAQLRPVSRSLPLRFHLALSLSVSLVGQVNIHLESSLAWGFRLLHVEVVQFFRPGRYDTANCCNCCIQLYIFN